jgi:oligopeptide transport system substrate-binding protein
MYELLGGRTPAHDCVAPARTFEMRAARSLAALIAALMIAVAPAFAETVIHRGNRSEPSALDPHRAQTVYENNVLQDLFEGLTAYDAAGEVIPAVATSWDVSPDGRIYTFNLRDGLEWSDGTPLSADDVVFSFRRLMKPETAALYAQLFYLVKNGREVNTGAVPVESLAVHAPDSRTIEIELTGPAPYFPQILANGFAAVIPRHAIEEHGENWAKPGTMVSNGAYTLEHWSPQDRIEIVRNAHFHDAENVALDRVIYYPTADTVSAVARFRGGELDVQYGFAPEQAGSLRELLPGQVHLSPSLGTFYLTLNTTRPNLKDARVRRALSLAIDRRVITDKVRRAGEPPTLSYVPPVTAGYSSPQVDYADMPMGERRAEAVRLLREVGYGDANPLKITYAYSTNPENRRLAVIIAAMWKRVGVLTVLANREGKILFSSLRAGDFEVAFIGWSADYNEASTFLYTLRSTTVNANYSRYNNPEYDALMIEAGQTADTAVRAALMRRAEALMLAEQPIIPLYNDSGRYLVAKYVKGWQDNAVEAHLSRYLSIER